MGSNLSSIFLTRTYTVKKGTPNSRATASVSNVDENPETGQIQSKGPSGEGQSPRVEKDEGPSGEG